MKCDACKGTGEQQGGPGDGAPCLKCGGSGQMQAERQLVSGAVVPVDRSHAEINAATGQQRDYVVLTPEKRAQGFVKPVRYSYVHLVCQTSTRMASAIAETYARQPTFYSGTFCAHCRQHFSLDQFEWEDGEPMHVPLQVAWAEQRAKLQKENRQRRIAHLRDEIVRLEEEGLAQSGAG